MNRFLTLLLAGLVLAGCASEPSTDQTEPAAEAESDRVNIPFREDGSLTISRDGEVLRTFAIEIAEDDSSRNRGLMQRDGLPDDSGMLFLFDSETEQGFWMANTRIALDLIFIRSNGEIQSISKYIQPMRTETIPSNGPAQYVFEVEAGVSDSIGLIEGDVVAWERHGSEADQ